MLFANVLIYYRQRERDTVVYAALTDVHEDAHLNGELCADRTALRADFGAVTWVICHDQQSSIMTVRGGGWGGSRPLM